MLENWIKPQIPEEEELEERLHAARSKLSVLQMQIKEHGLPVLVLFEGWGTAGKGSVLGKVIRILIRDFQGRNHGRADRGGKTQAFISVFCKDSAKGSLSFLIRAGWMR
ncbi:MAG: hypothetical protein ACLRI8_02235 [Agathobacter rectalis]